ncbi:MAG: asparagine synthase (glutamine-hydrolyzing) [Gemmatimonadetes bacterium]|nr:MAG: asparagine synthase (glutamine-hydrolyzing) [Gemmatimonadota bacterium]
MYAASLRHGTTIDTKGRTRARETPGGRLVAVWPASGRLWAGRECVITLPNPQGPCQRRHAPESTRVACAPHKPRVPGYRQPLPLRKRSHSGWALVLLDSPVRMCGIVGIVHSDPARPVPPAMIRQMCEAIRHRGPDDEGVYVERAVGLGMRRLSIIDLTGGRQPIFNEDRSKLIVFNGEIYNYRELRRGLIARGHVFATQGDTEVILHLFEEYGPECVQRLRGMFAFAIWDSARQTLFLARDRFGIKPLYVTSGPWGIGFASELKALHAVGLASRELDWEALDTYFQLGYIPAPATPFREIRKLEPGHTAVWNHTSGLTTRQYWDLPRDRTPAPHHLEAQIADWLDESVQAHLVSDVPVAAFLSGGLDSSAVVASWALASDAPPHAFTAKYFGSGAASADETDLARRLAAAYGVTLTEVDIHPEVRDLLEPITYALDEPHADESAVPTWLLSQAVGASYKVALMGIGGDELFAGYRRHIGFLAGEHYARLPRPVQRGVSALANLLREPRGASLTVDRLKRFLRTGNQSAPERFLNYLTRFPNPGRHRLYAPALRHRVSGVAASGWLHHLHQHHGTPAGLSTALYLDYKTFLADDVLALSDRMSMAHSLEIRVPLVDHELVERVFPLPDRVKIGLWQNKRLLKRALQGRLPAQHLRAPKRGFVGPTAAWLRHELRDMIEDELAPARLQRLGYFDPSVVRNLLDDHFSRRHNRTGILWALLCFSVWHRGYVEAAPVAPLDDEANIPHAEAAR